MQPCSIHIIYCFVCECGVWFSSSASKDSFHAKCRSELAKFFRLPGLAIVFELIVIKLRTRCWISSTMHRLARPTTTTPSRQKLSNWGWLYSWMEYGISQAQSFITPLGLYFPRRYTHKYSQLNIRKGCLANLWDNRNTVLLEIAMIAN